MSTVGDIMSTAVDIMSTVGDIVGTLGDTQYRGGYHEHMGDIMSTVGGTIFCYLNTPTVLRIPRGTQDIRMVLMISPRY